MAIVLDNLVENALRYAPRGTDVELGWSRAGERAVLAVSDRGPGLGAEEAERVFERFVRGAESRGAVPGTGLGLAIVRTLARRWGGDATLAPRAGGGTRAEVSFPATVPSTAPRRTEKATVA